LKIQNTFARIFATLTIFNKLRINLLRIFNLLRIKKQTYELG